MEELFKELAWKCFKNDLLFDYGSCGSLNIWDEKINVVSNGYIKDWDYEEPVKTLKRMHQEVDEFIEIEAMEDTEVSRPRGVSSDELKMKEAGHKTSDF